MIGPELPGRAARRGRPEGGPATSPGPGRPHGDHPIAAVSPSTEEATPRRAAGRPDPDRVAGRRTAGGDGADAVTVVTIKAGARRPLLDWREVARYRDLLATLALRDVQVRYKQTALGVLWVVLQPLLASVILTFVFGLVAGMRSGSTPYLLVTFSGLLAWNAFGAALMRSGSSLLANGHLVTKVYFPREVLPLAAVAATLLDLAVSLAAMAALLVAFRAWPGPEVLLLPVWLGLLVASALGLGMMAGAVMVRFRDVQHVLPVALSLGLYASPVAWPASAVPGRYRWAVALNPLAGPIEAVRWSLLGGDAPGAASLAYGAAAAALALVAGAWTFRRMERRFADVL